jgi:hypothetical protein
MLTELQHGGVFALNCVWTTPEEIESHLPSDLKRNLAKKDVQF